MLTQMSFCVNMLASLADETVIFKFFLSLSCSLRWQTACTSAERISGNQSICETTVQPVIMRSVSAGPRANLTGRLSAVQFGPAAVVGILETSLILVCHTF